MKNVVLTCCFGSCHERLLTVEKFFRAKGYETICLFSDFDHVTKKRITIQKPAMSIHVPSYQRNLSFRRIFSHIIFSRKVQLRLKELSPDIIYAIVPPNSLVKCMSEYKAHNRCTLIYDVCDMWPETFPYEKNVLYNIPFSIWTNLREKHFSKADVALAECGLFAALLQCHVVADVQVLPFSISDDAFTPLCPSAETIEIAYIGTVNNIVDIASITLIIREISKYKPTILHVIGDGEKLDELIVSSRSAGATVKPYGKIYDTHKKASILYNCSFGLNMMRNNSCIGLTMKSVEYLRLGLPLLNNIPADTYDLVNTRQCGFNIDSSVLSNVVLKIIKMDQKELVAMGAVARKVYETNFTDSIFFDTLEKCLSDIL